MKSMGTKKIVYGAFMASLITVATMVIHIPSAFNGYIHLGDGLVLISGILLGPMTGGISAGIGSMMADFFSGYLYQRLIKRSGIVSFRLVPFISSGLSCSTIVTGGYFLFECVVYGKSAALLNIPLNLVQNSFSLLIAGTLLPFLLRRNELRSLVLKKDYEE